jgi:hypothetical protein
MPVAWKWIIAIVLSVAAINFVTMPAKEYVGDGIAVRIETIGLINTGRWAVPPDVAREWGERGQYFYENASGAFYPKYGILNTLIYVPPLWIQKIATGDLNLDSDSTLSLNLFNIVLSCATAAYLALLARRYTNSNVTMSIFVIASLYCTFWWHYLRAQTFEIYLTLFVLAFYYHFASGCDSEQRDVRNRQLLIAVTYLGLLCLSKIVFVIFVPAAIAFFVRSRSSKQSVGDELIFWWLPLSIFLCLLLATNWYKFGFPFATGYTQWSEESQPFTPNLWPGFVGLTASKQGSMFLHFPVLIFALIGWPMFVKNRCRDARRIGSFAALLFAVACAFTNWKGESCYGPRYLLPVLPLVSLPFVHFVDWLHRFGNKGLKWLMRGAITISFAYSLALQVSVNSLPFFFWYQLLDIADQNAAASNYLDSRTFGTINLDFVRDELGWSFRFRNDFANKLDRDQFLRLEGLRAETKPNYYFFSGR